MLITVELSLSCYSTCQTKTLKVSPARANYLSITLIIPSLSVEEGDRIAQLIIEKIHTPEILEVEVRVEPFVHAIP